MNTSDGYIFYAATARLNCYDTYFNVVALNIREYADAMNKGFY